MCLHVSSSCNNCSCLLQWSLWVTTLNGSLLWSTYLHFPCPIELRGSLLWLPVLPIQCPALPKPHRKWFSDSWEVLGQVSFSTEVLKFLQCDSAGCGHFQGWFPLTGLPWNLPIVPGICAGSPSTFARTSSQAHQLVMSLKTITKKKHFVLFDWTWKMLDKPNHK